jgi:endosialidase-like protein
MSHKFNLCVVVVCASLGIGDEALGQCFACSDGNNNTSVGTGAISNPNGASFNTAVGSGALRNTNGPNNTAVGYLALASNSSGKGNAAQGVNALYNNTTGIRNIGIGSNALYTNSTGSYNIALGFDAGYNVTTGSNNIEIGTSGTESDNNTIQIGAQGTQTFAAIAGIYGTPVSGSAVYVTSTGQLGVQASSERFKTDIAPMPELSAKLAQLRPVTFHYKTDAKGIRQYGLIAEEVAKVYPELVIRDDSGKIQGVHYEELAPMLLNEVQRQQRINVAQAAEIRSLRHNQESQFAAQTEQIRHLEWQLTALLAKQQSAELARR